MEFSDFISHVEVIVSAVRKARARPMVRFEDAHAPVAISAEAVIAARVATVESDNGPTFYELRVWYAPDTRPSNYEFLDRAAAVAVLDALASRRA